MVVYLKPSINITFRLHYQNSDLQIELDPCIEHFQSNNWCTQPSTGKTIVPKWTYLVHPERFFDETKGDTYGNVIKYTMEHLPKNKNEHILVNHNIWLLPSQYHRTIVTVFEEKKEDQNEYHLGFESYIVHYSYNQIMKYNNKAYI